MKNTSDNDDNKIEMVRLRNTGKSTIFGHHPDEFHENGEPKKYAFGPESSGAFHPDEAEKLKRLYPKTIMDIGDVAKLFHEDKTEEEANGISVPVISIEEAEAQKQAALAEMREAVDARFDQAVNEAVARALAARNKEDAKNGKTEKTAEEIAFDKELEDEEKAKAAKPAEPKSKK